MELKWHLMILQKEGKLFFFSLSFTPYEKNPLAVYLMLYHNWINDFWVMKGHSEMNSIVKFKKYWE